MDTTTLQEYLRQAASRGRETEVVGPFLATFDPATDHPFLNYAIPDDGAEPTAADALALIAAYERRGRIPRLEFLAPTAPAAEAVLVAEGFHVEARLAAMTATAAADIPPPEGIELAAPASDDELLAMLAVQHAAFGDGAPGDPDLDRARAGRAAGGIHVLARETASGTVAGGGIATPPGDAGITVVAGIGVDERFRRRGIATALTAELTRRAFAAGVTTAFLEPADDDAQRVYERAGFRRIGQIVHIRRG